MLHFKGWNFCRKFLTNWTAIKNSTHHSQIALWVAAKPWKSSQISRFWRPSNLTWRVIHSQIALWVAAKPWKSSQISRFWRPSNLTWRVMGRDFFSGPFADRGSSTRFLTFFATFWCIFLLSIWTISLGNTPDFRVLPLILPLKIEEKLKKNLHCLAVRTEIQTGNFLFSHKAGLGYKHRFLPWLLHKSQGRKRCARRRSLAFRKRAKSRKIADYRRKHRLSNKSLTGGSPRFRPYSV